MNSILTAILIIPLIVFGLSTISKVNQLKGKGVSNIEINFQTGSICGKKLKIDGSEIWVCDSIYVLNLGL